VCIVGGYVFFYMCPPRFAKAGGHPTIRAATRAATRGTPGRSRSVVCGMKLSRFLCALLLFFVNDADERHGRQLLSYRLSGPRVGYFGGWATCRRAIDPRDILIACVRRSSRGMSC